MSDGKARTQNSKAANAKASRASGAIGRTASAARRTLDEVAMIPFLRKITFFSNGGSFLDGYVLSLIGVALAQIGPQLNLTTEWSAAVGPPSWLASSSAASWVATRPT